MHEGLLAVRGTVPRVLVGEGPRDEGHGVRSGKHWEVGDDLGRSGSCPVSTVRWRVGTTYPLPLDRLEPDPSFRPSRVRVSDKQTHLTHPPTKE